MEPLCIPAARCNYRGMVGVGGIGSGSFFALDGNETLGREESRGGRFLDRRDYCKLHIIAHYTRVLLGPEFLTLPVGKVGDDEVGTRLYAEMECVGIDMRYVERCRGEQTLFSFCYLYPDGSGGNMTTDDSASSHVHAVDVFAAEKAFSLLPGAGIVLAVPEVPVEARAAMLELGTKHHCFRVASFASQEMSAAFDLNLLRWVDLLAINIDEAAAAAGTSAEIAREEIARRAVTRFRMDNPAIHVSITAGKDGIWYWDGEKIRHQPAFLVPVESTAGAGDAHTAGMIAGLTAGLPFSGAVQLGALVAAMAVTSPHTIHPGIDRASLRSFVRQYHLTVSPDMLALLGERDS